MKKLIFIFLSILSTAAYGQADFPEGVQISGGQPTVSAANFLTTTDVTSSGLQGKVAPVNVTIPTVPINYSVSTPTLGAHLSGIDTRLGQISSTTAGLTQRIYFTADNTTVNSVVYFASNATGKGSTAAGSPPNLVLADNTKGYFTKDLISIPQPSATIGYAGSYSGNLTVSATPTPVATQQRFTVEVYRTNNLGTPIASGVSGAPVGDLGVTVVAILDSGELNINAGAITNVAVNGILTQNITINTGERLRYHVSAAKIGAGGGNVTFGVYYGSSYNSYYDVPVAIRTNAVLNDSGVTGVTATDALNLLNTGKLSNTDALKLYNGDKKIVKNVKKAVFSFIWDDIQDSDLLVYNIFQEFGYIPSYALVTNNLNSGNKDLYIDLYKKGASILAHSVSHPDMSGTTLTNAQVNTQMVTSKNIIEGYGMRVSGWVTPSSTLNALYYPQVDKNFGYAFTNTGGALNETVSPLRLSRVGLESAMAGHNLANVQAIIDDAITNNKMVVFYGHHLPSTYLNPDTTPYLTEIDLRNILTYLKTKSDENLCEVMTTDEAIQTYYGFSSGVEGNLVKWTGRNTQSNSLISDDGNSAIVTGLFRTNGNVNLTYLPSTGSASNGNVGSFNNVVNADGIASIVNFNSPRSGGANASVYFGALNTSTDYRSITVLGRRTGSATWLESGRIDYDGRLLFGTQTNNGVDIAQFNGTVSGSDATLSNQFTTKAQLDLKQNIITNPVTGTGTTNFISKWSSSSAQANSGIFDNGTNIGFGESTIFNDYVTIKKGSPNLLGLYNSQDIATTVASGILSLGQMSSTTKIPAADISGFLAVVGNDTNGTFRIRTRRAGTMTEAVRIFASGGVSIGNTTDLGSGTLNVTGNITTIAGTTANHAVIKSQLDAAVPYKKYVALISQSGTSAPTATVLENTLGGTVVWTRSGVGQYVGTLSGVFTSNKTFILTGNMGGNTGNYYGGSSPTTSTISVTSNNNLGSPADTILSGAPIEIKVYP